MISLPGPSRASLINAAVDEGRIDEVTGLVYRANSALGLPGVPEEFAAGVPRPDDSVFTEMAVLMPSLAEQDQAKFRPFLVRPTDPESVFAAKPVAFVGGAQLAQAAAPVPPCRKWADSGPDDPRFKVWACADSDPDQAEFDIAQIVQLFQQVWAPMTKSPPSGMGEPLPDAYPVSNSAAYGGDDRIDVYALELGQVVYRDGDNRIEDDAAAEALSAEPYPPSGASSGFMLVNRNRLDDAVAMKQDVIHEFFHVLQFAHTVVATHKGTVGHWFTEASATWAETFYDRDHSDIPEAWFPNHFQTTKTGLEDPDEDHQYGAFVWPLFMEQEKGASAVFNAWSAIGQIGKTDFAAVTQAISDQLAFADNFGEFALRNLDIGEVLASAGVKRYRQLDPRFPEPNPPTTMVGKTLNPGDPYVSSDPIPPLGAAYLKLAIGARAQEVTVSLANLLPAEQASADLLIQYEGEAGVWHKESLAGGGQRKFCRDDENVHGMYIVVSNHAVTGPLGGFFEVSAKESCQPQQVRIEGDLTWNTSVTDTIGGETDTSSGTAHLDLVWDPTTGFYPDSGGTYSFSYHDGYPLCPATMDFAGIIKTYFEAVQPSPGIGKLLTSGAPRQDISVSLELAEHWDTPCGDGTMTHVASGRLAFPWCATGGVTALFNGQESYVFTCEMDRDTYTTGPGEEVSGSMSGTLTAVEFESPSP